MKCRFNIKFEYRLSLLYLILGALWILFSDELLNLLITDLEVRASIQLYKGWFYVLLTAIFFFIFIKRYVEQLRESQTSLSNKNLELEVIYKELEKKNRELSKAKEKAEESDKLKTAFLNNISHELRTPMNSILGFSDILQKPGLSNEQRQNYITYINRSTHQLLGMMTDVVEISQLQQGHLSLNEKACDLRNILENIEKKALEKTKDKDIRLTTDHDLYNNEIMIDCYKLTRILDHLIDNAVKFTTKGLVNLSVKQKKTVLEIDITDTGIGISDEVKDKIFDAFRQEELGLTRNYGGSGLGLTLVRAYLNLMKGTVDIKSSKTQGTKISLTIPYHAAEHMPDTDGLPDDPDFSDKTVLIADDETINYFYLKELLDDLNIKSFHASNGREAIDLCKKHNKIDLVLMDIKMPVMDGYEATKEIRKFNADLPVIAQSAYVLEKNNHTLQFNDILPKPITEQDLNRIIKKYLG